MTQSEIQTSLTGRAARVYDLKEKPGLEAVKRCAWPTGCFLSAAYNVIDFGFNPPVIRSLCGPHADSFLKLTRKAMKEPLMV